MLSGATSQTGRSIGWLRLGETAMGATEAVTVFAESSEASEIILRRSHGGLMLPTEAAAEYVASVFLELDSAQLITDEVSEITSSPPV